MADRGWKDIEPDQTEGGRWKTYEPPTPPKRVGRGTPHEQGWIEWLISNGLRTVPAVGGAVIGAGTGLFTGGTSSIPGAMAGGAGGAALGNAAGQAFDMWMDPEREFNLAELGVETAMGGIPVLGKAPGAGATAKELMKYAAKIPGRSALEGGLINAIGTPFQHYAQTGDFDASMQEYLLNTGLGAGLGYGTGHIMGRRPMEARARGLEAIGGQPPNVPGQPAGGPVNPFTNRFKNRIQGPSEGPQRPSEFDFTGQGELFDPFEPPRRGPAFNELPPKEPPTVRGQFGLDFDEPPDVVYPPGKFERMPKFITINDTSPLGIGNQRRRGYVPYEQLPDGRLKMIRKDLAPETPSKPINEPEIDTSIIDKDTGEDLSADPILDDGPPLEEPIGPETKLQGGDDLPESIVIKDPFDPKKGFYTSRGFKYAGRAPGGYELWTRGGKPLTLASSPSTTPDIPLRRPEVAGPIPAGHIGVEEGKDLVIKAGAVPTQEARTELARAGYVFKEMLADGRQVWQRFIKEAGGGVDEDMGLAAMRAEFQRLREKYKALWSGKPLPGETGNVAQFHEPSPPEPQIGPRQLNHVLLDLETGIRDKSEAVIDSAFFEAERMIQEEVDPAIIRDNLDNLILEYQHAKTIGDADQIEFFGALNDAARDKYRSLATPDEQIPATEHDYQLEKLYREARELGINPDDYGSPGELAYAIDEGDPGAYRGPRDREGEDTGIIAPGETGITSDELLQSLNSPSLTPELRKQVENLLRTRGVIPNPDNAPSIDEPLFGGWDWENRDPRWIDAPGPRPDISPDPPATPRSPESVLEQPGLPMPMPVRERDLFVESVPTEGGGDVSPLRQQSLFSRFMSEDQGAIDPEDHLNIPRNLWNTLRNGWQAGNDWQPNNAGGGHVPPSGGGGDVPPQNFRERWGWGQGNEPRTPTPEELARKEAGEKEPPSIVGEILSVPTNATTTGDLSAPGRQGLSQIFTPEFWSAGKAQIKALFSQEAYEKLTAEIKSKDMFRRAWNPATGKFEASYADKINFKLMSTATEMGQREEATASRWLETGGIMGPETIFGMKNYVRSAYNFLPGRIVRATNRAYVLFLNHLRANRLEKLLNLSRDMAIEGLDTGFARPGFFRKAVTQEQALNLNPYHNLKLGKELADFINTATGRGPLRTHIAPHRGAEISLEKSAGILGKLLFSPHLLSSRIRMLNPSTYIMASPQVRKQYLHAALSTAAAWGMFSQLIKLGGGEDATVSYDPTSADFGKVRIGDTRLDPGGGFLQFITAISRLYEGGTTSSASQKYSRYGTGYQAETSKDAIERFFVNKLNPTTKFAYDIANATEYNPVHMYDRTMQMFIPLIAQDMYGLGQEHPELLPLLGIPITVGMGTQSYGKGESISKFISPENDWLQTGGGFRELTGDVLPSLRGEPEGY